jgi:hypothetical protein
MSVKIPAPKHAFEASITIGADTWQELESALEQIGTEVAMHPPGPKKSISGRYSIDIEHRPEQTPEKYREEADAYLIEIRAARTPSEAWIANKDESGNLI